MRKFIAITIAASAITLSCPSAFAQREPETMAALDRMGASLRKLTSFAIAADVTEEEVLTSGQKLQASGKIFLRSQRPNRFRIDANSDRKTRSIYYNGKSVTIYAARLGYYAAFDAPATIPAVIKAAGDNYGIEFPLAELFAWGTDQSLTASLTSALAVGSETIGDFKCDHYAMRQPGTDWQIWIRQGEEALPCKLVITNTADASMPQFSAILSWSPHESFTADTFDFTPPASAKRIVMADLAKATEKTK